VGPDVELLALADQDDRWYPEKLEVLGGAVDAGALLAFSDSRVIDGNGTVLAESFFGRRRNNTSDLRQMVFANTVTGASAMFRRELLARALPFPPSPGTVSFHDHWLAVVAVASGELEYIDRPLYDYVQHAGNLLGHTLREQPLGRRRYRGPWMLRARGAYQELLTRTVTIASALQTRLHGQLSPADARELGRITAVEQSRKALTRMALHAVAARRATSSTLGAERDVVEALVWRRRMSRAAVKRDRVNHPWFTAAPDLPPRAVVAADELPPVRELIGANTPLRLDIDATQPARVNLLLGLCEPWDDGETARYGVGLLSSLEATGPRTRIVAVDGGGTGAENVEILDASDRRSTRVPVSPADVFIAADAATAELAYRAALELGDGRFVYVIDDDDSLRLPAGARAMQAQQSLTLPHCALFTSALIRDHFRAQRLGVFAAGDAWGDERSAVVTCPINATLTPATTEQRRLGPRRLAFWADPGRTGADGMFELGLLAVRRAVELGLLAGCDVNLVGPRSLESAIEIVPDVDLVFAGALQTSSRASVVGRHDVGLALAGTPRPNLVSLEMAAGGMVTVTNTCGVRNRQWVEGRSANLIAAEPTIEALAAALGDALERAADIEARTAGANVDWPREWSEVLDARTLDHVGSLLSQCSGEHKWRVATAAARTGQAPQA
jgi:hypothetical protein